LRTSLQSQKNPLTLACLPFITAMSGASGAYHSLVAMRSLDAFTPALNLTSCNAPRGGRLHGNASPPIGSLPVFRLSRSICACSVPHRRCPRVRPRVLSKNIWKFHDLCHVFLRKNPCRPSRVSLQCIFGKMVHEYNYLGYCNYFGCNTEKIRISNKILKFYLSYRDN